MREAGDRTTWTDPDAAYEAAVHAAVDAVFESADVQRVLTDLAALVDEPGRSNSLAAKLVALTMPGVPDVYQGSELWETSLVDPDNRRPVDFDHRAAVLGGEESDDAVDKLHVTCSALTLRRDRPELFTSYTPVTASGPAAHHVLAFDRGGAVTVATRLPVGLAAAGGWGDTTLDLPVRPVARRADRPHHRRRPRRAARHPPRRAAREGGLVIHGPFDVWAPRARRLRLSVADAIVEMVTPTTTGGRRPNRSPTSRKEGSTTAT